jgi:hypothetical protein
VVITDADCVILACSDPAGPAKRDIGEPMDRIRVAVGQAEVSIEGSVAVWIIRILV